MDEKRIEDVIREKAQECGSPGALPPEWGTPCSVKKSHASPEEVARDVAKEVQNKVENVVKGVHARVEDMVKNFDWNEENEGEEDAPEAMFGQDVINCAAILQRTLAGLLKPEYLSEKGMNIPIPLSTHPFLDYCVDKKWNDESRGILVELLHTVFLGMVDCEYKKGLAGELNTRVLPITPEHRRLRTVKKLWVGEDPLETDNNKRFYIELEFGEAENPEWIAN